MRVTAGFLRFFLSNLPQASRRVFEGRSGFGLANQSEMFTCKKEKKNGQGEAAKIAGERVGGCVGTAGVFQLVLSVAADKKKRSRWQLNWPGVKL